MALLVITDEDILRATPPTEGWFLTEIVAHIEKIKPKADKEYNTHTFELKVIKQAPDVTEDNIGRIGMVVFYSTALGFMIPFMSAVMEAPLKKGIQFDPQSLVGKQVMGHNVKGIYNNAPVYRFEEWSPASGCPF